LEPVRASDERLAKEENQDEKWKVVRSARNIMSTATAGMDLYFLTDNREMNTTGVKMLITKEGWKKLNEGTIACS
jgi:hypothetical protein